MPALGPHELGAPAVDLLGDHHLLVRREQTTVAGVPVVLHVVVREESVRTPLSLAARRHRERRLIVRHAQGLHQVVPLLRVGRGVHQQPHGHDATEPYRADASRHSIEPLDILRVRHDAVGRDINRKIPVTPLVGPDDALPSEHRHNAEGIGIRMLV